MAIAPQTNITLLKVPLELTNKNQLTFSNKQAQFNYFSSLDKLELENATYQRKEGVIRFPELIDNLLEFNYVMYQNEAYSDKWFYAFITNMRYLNDTVTEISISADCFQTWQFDLVYKESFIEREMIDVNDDIAGNNLIPESLETGEFKIEGTADFEELEPLYVIAYLASEITLEGTTYHFTGGKYNGILNGIMFIVGDTDMINSILFDINVTQGLGQNIMTVFTIPKFACSSAINNPITGKNYVVLAGDVFQAIITKTFSSRPLSIDSYTPRNQKLLTYPYLYLGFNPPSGTNQIYRYEDFANGTPIFKMMCELCQNPTVCFIPQNYRGQTGDNVCDRASLNGYPTISWKTDYFNSWLAQNSSLVVLDAQKERYNYEINSIKSGMNLATGLVSSTLSTFSGDFAGGIASGLSAGANAGLNLASLDANHDFYIKNQLAQIEKQKMLPDSGSLGSSNATLFGYNMLKNIFCRYSIKRQFAERIDKYFDMYGYMTNMLKLPNLNNRPNWNYVKCLGINIIAHIPQNDLQVIKNMFNTGVTLWHNPATFLDYSQNNR